MTPPPPASPESVAGIDVGKHWLDVFVDPSALERRFANTRDGFATLGFLTEWFCRSRGCAIAAPCATGSASSVPGASPWNRPAATTANSINASMTPA